MSKFSHIIYLFFLFIFILPAASGMAITGAGTDEPGSVDSTSCATFSESERGEEAKSAYVVYRDFVKLKQYKNAKPYWEKVYRLAPGADGRRWTVYGDGIKIYEYFLKQTDDSVKQEQFKDKIFRLYDEIIYCYPRQEGYIAGRKAYDLFYRYPDYKPDSVTYALFKRAIDIQGKETPAFVFNPFTDLMIRQFMNDRLTGEEVHYYIELINELLEEKRQSGSVDEAWEVVMEYVPNRLAELEGVKGFYDCTYYLDKYFPIYEEHKDSCEIVKMVYGKLNWADCPKDDSLFQMVQSTIDEQCKFEISGSELVRSAHKSLQEGRYKDAVRQFKKAIAETDNAEKKASYNMVLGQIYYAHLKDFPTARRYALRAAELRSEWGNPYILIGKLYASSGPLCGPGRGWDSQIVVWVAIDTWKKAKRIDPSVASDANRLIASYAQYMPTKEDIFSRMHKVGDSYFVGCWIQRSTTIRPASDS